MGLFAEFDIVDDFGYPAETEHYGIQPNYSEGSQVFVRTFLLVSHSLVPVDTGYLESTLTADCDDTHCYAETNCEYAQYPEYGTWCQAAQPYFEPALEEAIFDASPYWDRAWRNAVEQERRLMAEERKDELRELESQADEADAEAETNPFAMFVYLLIMMIIELVKEFFESLFEENEDSRGNTGIPYVPEVIIT